MNYSKYKLSELFDKIDKLLQSYFEKEDDYNFYEKDNFEHKTDLSKKSYLMFLSNGDRIRVKIPKTSIPHLLGINTEYLKSTGLYKGMNSYEIMLDFIKNSNEAFQKHESGIINLDKILSPYINKKLDSLIENLNINTNCCEMICKYDRGKTYHSDRYYIRVTQDSVSLPSWASKVVSDRRLKNVGEKYTAGLDELKKLDFYHYTFKKDEAKTPMVGVMAQDLQKVFPDAVTKGEDGYLRIRLEDMFYAVINAVKELDSKISEIVADITSIKTTIKSQQETIDSLQKENAELKEEIKSIEKRIEKLEK